MNIIAQIIGFAGIAANALIYQQNSRLEILRMKLISDLLWAIHYFLIGAYSAAAIACIGIMREIVFIKRKRLSSLIIFLILSFGSAILTWNGYSSLLPSIASAASVISFYIGKSEITRIMSFPISGCMGTYSALTGSVAGVVNELLTVTSSIVALARSRGKRENQTVELK